MCSRGYHTDYSDGSPQRVLKQYLVIGLGRFGASVAKILYSSGEIVKLSRRNYSNLEAQASENATVAALITQALNYDMPHRPIPSVDSRSHLIAQWERLGGVHIFIHEGSDPSSPILLRIRD